MWLTVIALPDSFRNPVSYSTNTPNARARNIPCAYRATINLLTQAYPKRAGATQQATPSPSTRARPGIHFHLGSRLTPKSVTGFQSEQRPRSVRVDKMEVHRCVFQSHDDGKAERQKHDGDLGTAIQHYLEKLNLIVTCLGYLGPAGKIDDLMMDARTRMMSWLQRPVSMSVNIFSYTVSLYEDTRLLRKTFKLHVMTYPPFFVWPMIFERV